MRGSVREKAAFRLRKGEMCFGCPFKRCGGADRVGTAGSPPLCRAVSAARVYGELLVPRQRCREGGRRHGSQGGRWTKVWEGVSRTPQVQVPLPALQPSPLRWGETDRDIPDPVSHVNPAPGPHHLLLLGPVAANRHGYPGLRV